MMIHPFAKALEHIWKTEILSCKLLRMAIRVFLSLARKRHPDATGLAELPFPLLPRSAKLFDLFDLAGAGDRDRTGNVQLGKLTQH